jgi:tRNA A-37 threonylcarbamoyl transferase component Bud32
MESSPRLSEYGDSLLEESKEPQEGNTNEVAIGKNRVARRYNDPSSIQRHISGLLDEGYGQKGRQRIENSEIAYKKRDEIGFRIPERIHSDGVIEEVEKVRGPTLEQYIQSIDKEEMKKVVAEFAGALKDTHNNGFALRDCRLENFIYEDCKFSDEDYIAALDTEWFEANASEEHIVDDLRGLAVNLSQLPEEIRGEFKQTFEETYGEDLDEYVTMRARRDMIIESTVDSVSKRDFSRIKNTLKYISPF